MTLRTASILLVALFAVPAAAEGPYVELEVGPSFFSDSDLSGTSTDLEYDTGFVVGGAAGYRFIEQARAELAVSYRQSDTDNASGEVGLLGVMANGFFDIDLDLLVTPYVGAGVGLGAVFTDFRAGSTRVEDEDTEFAYNIMGGAAFDLTEELVLDAGYRYFGMTEARIQGVDVEFDVHEIVFSLRYEF
jgi:opacity protein-like surface antigen